MGQTFFVIEKHYEEKTGGARGNRARKEGEQRELERRPAITQN